MKLSQGLQEWGGLSPGIALLVAAGLHALALFHLFGLLPLVYIWLERKVSARLQDRLGPTRVGGRFGWLQTVADGLKLIQKEDLVPAAADRWLFRLAPLVAAVAAFATFMVLPFSELLRGVACESGLFLALALLSIEVFGVILGGYASGSKWALFGAIREAAQMVSYEIPLALCVLVPLVAVGSLDFADVGRVQSGLFTNWLIFRDPFCFVAAILFFTAAIASVKRAPFDLAEAESELVAGFHTEYSGLRWSFFFLAEYASMFTVSVIAAVLFLGAWHTGTGMEDWLLGGLHQVGRNWPVTGIDAGTYLINVLGLMVTVTKGSLLVAVQMWVRWSLPRLRIDQVMTTCLKYLLPASCVLLLGAALWPLLLVSTLGRTTLLGAPFASPLGNQLVGNQLVGQQVVDLPVDQPEHLPVVTVATVAGSSAIPSAEGDAR